MHGATITPLLLIGGLDSESDLADLVEHAIMSDREAARRGACLSPAV